MQKINQIESGFLTDYEEVSSANKNRSFGSFIKTELKAKDCGVSNQKDGEGEIVFKLFGIIPIRKVVVKMNDNDDYYVGGAQIGLAINTDGVIVVDSEEESLASSIKTGDIIQGIDGKKVSSYEDISDVLQDAGKSVEVEFLRKNRSVKKMIKTYESDGKKRLGLWVKDDVAGVGTLSFVNSKTMKYGALGHPIVDTYSDNIIPVSNGKVVECDLIGIKKGQKNDPGELKCVLHGNSKSKGNIDENTKYGVKGTLSDLDGLVDENKIAKLGGRLSIKPGKAKLISCISGIREEYDIEIIKAAYQKAANDKSIIFRVKDKRLISLSGGIVQGMSGSPIMQDGKIVGVVTHVFTSDATMGYGVYVDWMI